VWKRGEGKADASTKVWKRGEGKAVASTKVWKRGEGKADAAILTPKRREGKADASKRSTVASKRAEAARVETAERGACRAEPTLGFRNCGFLRAASVRPSVQPVATKLLKTDLSQNKKPLTRRSF
jgi:hypothetical protein